MNRYLTAREKAEHVERWMGQRAEYEADRARALNDPVFFAERFGQYKNGNVDLNDPDPLSGCGFPDPAVYELTDRLNAIDGVCTVQSCAGHKVGPTYAQEGVDTGVSLWCGGVWIRVNRPMMDAVLRWGYDLTEHSMTEIERVSIILDRWGWGGDVIAITFAGMNDNAEALRRSSNIIVGFFERLAKGVDVQRLQAKSQLLDRLPVFDSTWTIEQIKMVEESFASMLALLEPQSA